MISNKYINAIIATITAISIFFTSLFYVKSKNITINNTTSSSNFTYLDTVFNKEQITEIDIEVDEDNWNYLLENAANEEYINANITVNGSKYYNVGIRAKGNSSLSTVVNDDTTDRYSFKVKFDEYVDGQTLDGLSKIALNNVISDATYMKEYLSYDLLNKMGVPTPAFTFTNITLNGDEWGLYFAVEVVEEEFIERTYGSLYGNLYKPEGNEIGAKDNKNMKPNINNVENPIPPNMNNIQNGENVTPPNIDNSQMGENTSPPSIGNVENAESSSPLMDNKETSKTLNPSRDKPINTQGNENFKDNVVRDKIMGGGMGSSNGANLVYTDDNKDSYSDIFDNSIFKTTTDSDEDKVIEMIKNLSEGTNLEKYLNVDEILRYFAVNTFLVNLDSYASNMKHNYYLYERDGVFEILPWDYNLSFGAFNIGTASNAINFPIDSPVTDSLENSPLIGKLLEVDEYKETYHKYLQEIVDYVNSGTYENTINEVNSLITDYVKNDPTAFYTYEEYTTSLPELINFGIDRAKSISAQLDGSQPSTSYGNIETSVNLTALGSNDMNNKNKNMDMQRPFNNPLDGTSDTTINKDSQMNKPNTDSNIDSTSASSENTTPQGEQIQSHTATDSNQYNAQAQMQRPSDNNDINPATNDTFENDSTQEGQMKNQNNTDNIFIKGNMTNNEVNSFNIRSNLLVFGGYLLLLIIAIIFVAMFKKRKYKY